MPWYDTQGKLNTVVQGVQSTVFPLAPVGYLVPGDPGVPSTVYHTQWINLLRVLVSHIRRASRRVSSERFWWSR